MCAGEFTPRQDCETWFTVETKSDKGVAETKAKVKQEDL